MAKFIVLREKQPEQDGLAYNHPPMIKVADFNSRKELIDSFNDPMAIEELREDDIVIKYDTVKSFIKKSS